MQKNVVAFSFYHNVGPNEQKSSMQTDSHDFFFFSVKSQGFAQLTPDHSKRLQAFLHKLSSQVFEILNAKIWLTVNQNDKKKLY